jgi:hypothetical protein
MGKNRCLRCNRELKDPNARYGWRCAEILGVDENLNYAGDGPGRPIRTASGRPAPI